MVSVIISSADAALLAQVNKNIENTIAVPFEIIAFDNADGKKGICEVYNEGAARAKYDILCFMHEDIDIKTTGWGKYVADIFANTPNLGLIGIVGNAYKTISPSGWNGELTFSDYGNIIQHYKHARNGTAHYFRNPDNKKLIEAACVDGVWFCTTKKIATEIPFDQGTFKGFHAYDLDFSLAVSQKYKVGILSDILIEHFSDGRYDKTWMAETLKLHKKWNEYLPLNIAGLNKEQMILAEKATFKHFILTLIKLGFPMNTAFKMLSLNKFKQLDSKLYRKLQFYILKNYIFRKRPTH